MKANSSEIIFIVDRSGSMASIASAMRSGFDEFVNAQKALPGECKVTLTRFDDQYEVVYAGKPLAEVPPLELDPRNMTALLDAIGKTINDTGTRLAAMAEADRPSRILVVVITDGHENSSKEFTKEQVRHLITQQREQYSWEFIFLGATEDAIDVATSYGIPSVNAAFFNTADKNSSRAVMRSVSHSMSLARSAAPGAKVSYNVQDSYESALKDVAGEIDVDGTPNP